MQNIQKSYYLRQTINNKVVLMGFVATSDTECQEKILLIADEYEKSSPRVLFTGGIGDHLFALRVGKNFVVCCQIKGCFYISPPCKEYRTINDKDLLLLQDVWWRWKPDNGSMECLGKKVWKGIDLFIDEDETTSSEGFVTLSFYNFGQAEVLKCKKCKILTPELDFYGHKIACNAMKIVDEKGSTQWISIGQFRNIILTSKRYKE